MPLSTGTPVGSILSQEEIYVEGAPNFYIQDNTASPLNNPDSDGYYWNLSGTVAKPVISVACVQDVALTEGLTMNAIRCDTVGDKGMIQRRDYLEFNLTILSPFPFTSLRHFLNASIPTTATGYEKMGIGAINNSHYYMAYAPRVYDPDSGDYLAFHLHRAQFVDAWTINMKGGEPWTINGLKLRAFADSSKPANQMFATVIRSDVSALP